MINRLTEGKAMKVLGRFLMGLAALVCFAGAAQAAVIVLDFEGVNATYPSGYAQVLGFYNGGTSSDGTSGTNFGIDFTDNALAICLNTPGVVCSNTSRGGLGNPTSDKGALFFLSGSQTFMNVPAGFDTGFSFFYTALFFQGSVSVYDDLNGTGNLLASLTLTTTPSTCDPQFSAGFCPFLPDGISFNGIAKSVSFAGVANQVVFDDITFGSVTPGGGTNVPEPASMILFGAGLVGLGVLRYRRKSA
jgi:PEP-CTERM motif